jgi:hypothetical protein
VVNFTVKSISAGVSIQISNDGIKLAVALCVLPAITCAYPSGRCVVISAANKYLYFQSIV